MGVKSLLECKLRDMEAPVTFGEIALLFNTPRTATIKGTDHERQKNLYRQRLSSAIIPAAIIQMILAVSACVAWTIDRYVFSSIISTMNKDSLSQIKIWFSFLINLRKLIYRIYMSKDLHFSEK